MRRATVVIFLVILLTGGLALAGGHIRVTYPDSYCKQWFRGVRYAIKWDKSGIKGSRHVDISLVSGPLNLPIAANASNNGLYSWTIPATIPKKTYKIKITTRNGYVGESVAFKIVDQPPPPHIGAVSPASGAPLLIGARYPVRWNSTGIFGEIRISVLQGNSWKGNIYVGHDTHNFQWTVGRLDNNKWLNPGVYTIRIQAIQDYSIYSDIHGVKLSAVNLRPFGKKKPRLP